MQPLHHQPVTGLQASSDQPFVAYRAIRRQYFLNQFSVCVHHRRDGFSRAVTAHGGLRHQHCIGFDTLVDHGPHIHAGQQVLLGVGEHGAQGHRACGSVNRDFRELQFSFLLVGRSVFQQQFDFGLPA